MSRLLVKNIPASATPESLRTHFSSTKSGAFTITDVRVARKPDGTLRRFAFVGFKSEEQACAARDWFHHTFWGSQKITVEVVRGVKDAPAPRPNKRPRLATPARAPVPTVASDAKKSQPGAATSKEGDDALSAEFLNVMNPRTRKGPAWADGGAPVPVTSKTGQREPSPRPQGAQERAGADAAGNDVSDLDWMRSRMTKGIREGNEFEQSDEEAGELDDVEMANVGKPEEVSCEPPDPQDATRQTILSTARLFVRNLTFSCTTAELQELFGQFGQIEQVHIPLTPEHTPKGIAFVTYARPADAVAAWAELDGTTFQGRLLHILAGVERRKITALAPGDKKKTLKEERNDKKKREAGREFNWGMLYMNSDAVVSSIADRMNIPKADILGATEVEEGAGSQNPAVKLALAETHVIQETRRYFEDQGVVLASLSARSTPRSRTTILVKNIPYGTTAETLRSLFEPHGDIPRLLIPPSGTLAVVEYMHAEEAERAFRGVAYRRLGNSIIYLEWAPEGMLAVGSATGVSRAEVKPVTIREQDEGTTEPESVSIRSGSTLFVKNLSFATTTDRLAQVFRGLPSFAFARVQMKPAQPNHRTKIQPEEEKLSMGFGFVGFTDVVAARKAMKSMQGFVLDGHKLHVAFAGRGADEERKGEVMPKTKTAKMIVKNVPFEATKNDIRDLFGVYGTLKSVRVPKKFDARTRGFAFLEFVSRHEAENAFTALRHTHLLGRHLVLDWAAEGEQDVETLRRKVGVGFGGGGELPGKKRKLEISMEHE